MPAKLLNALEVLDYLNINKAELIRLIKQENLPFIRIGQEARFRPEQLEPWLEDRSCLGENPESNAAFVEDDFSARSYARAQALEDHADAMPLHNTPETRSEGVPDKPAGQAPECVPGAGSLAVTEPFLVYQQGPNLMLRIYMKKAAEAHRERMTELVRTLYPESPAESLVSRALDSASTPLELGQTPGTLDNPISLIVTRDKLNAFLFIHRDLCVSTSSIEEKVLSELARTGIRNGLDPLTIQHATHPEARGRILPLASGTAPRLAGRSELVVHFKTPREFDPRHMEQPEFSCDSPVQIQPCYKDQLLAEVIKPALARNGQDIYGKTIPCDSPSGALIKAGPNTYLSTDHSRIHASCNGIPYWRKNAICVDNVMFLPNVNHDSGNIQSKGRVIVQGDVESGFSVKTGGKIVVKGQMEAASLISAKSSIHVRQGIHGNGRAVMVAGTNIAAAFATGCQMQAGMNVNIESSLVRCTVRAGRNINLLGANSKTTASSLVAGQSISVGSAGSKTQVLTTLKILIPGDDNSDSERIVLENNITSVRKQIQQQKSRIMRLREQKSTAVEPERRQLKQMEILLSQHEAAYETFRQWIRDEELFHVDVRGTVWPGVLIVIEDREYKIKKPMSGQRFYYSNSGIKHKPL